MAGVRISLKNGYELGPDGKVRKSLKHLSVSERLKRKASKKVRVKR